jgi:hypothetical protein
MADARGLPQTKETSMMPHAPQGLGGNGHSAQARADRTLSHGEPAEPLLRVLPIKRWIPMDVHAAMDYVDGLTAASGYFTADDDAACWASIGLGASVIGVSLMTDYRLSVAKVIPIRAHETLDYLWGAACIAMPFALGYWKSSPKTAITHIAVGAGAIIASLFTDYRSYKQQRADEARRSQADLEPVMPT